MILDYLNLKVKIYFTMMKQYDMSREILGEINKLYFVILHNSVKKDINNWYFEWDALCKSGATVGFLLHGNLKIPGPGCEIEL